MLIDLSHEIESGMVTYKGLPAPHICDFWERQASAANYDDGSSFQIGRIDMVANTGTYIDAPFHRFVDAPDIAELPLESLAGLDAVVVRVPLTHSPNAPRAVDAGDLEAVDARGKAVLIHTGWEVHWRTDRYFHDHPFVTAAAAGWLVRAGAALVGIDSHNIDDTRGRGRPVHTTLLGAGVPIVEHLCNLAALPDRGARFTAVPARVAGIGSFPVRAFAEVRGREPAA